MEHLSDDALLAAFLELPLTELLHQDKHSPRFATFKGKALAARSTLTLVLGQKTDGHGVEQSAWDLVINSLAFHPMADSLEDEGGPTAQLLKSRLDLPKGLDEQNVNWLVRSFGSVTTLAIALDTQLLGSPGAVKTTVEAILKLLTAWKDRLVGFKLWYFGRMESKNGGLLENLWPLLDSAVALQVLVLDVAEFGGKESREDEDATEPIEVNLQNLLLTGPRLHSITFGSATHSLVRCLLRDGAQSSVEEIHLLRWRSPKELLQLEGQLAVRFRTLVTGQPNLLEQVRDKFTNVQQLTITIGGNWKIYALMQHLGGWSNLVSLIIRLQHQERIITRAEREADSLPPALTTVKSLVIYKRRMQNHLDNSYLDLLGPLFPSMKAFQLRVDQYRCGECREKVRQCAKRMLGRLAKQMPTIRVMEFVDEAETRGSFRRIRFTPESFGKRQMWKEEEEKK